MYSQAACCASASTCTGMRAASETRSTVGPLRYESSVWRTGSPTSSPEEPWPSCALGSTRQIRDFAGAGAAAVPPAFATDAAAANAILAASDTDESTSWFVVMASTPRAKTGLARFSYKRRCTGEGRPEQGLLFVGGC